MQNRHGWQVIQSKESLTAGHDPIWETGKVPNGYWDLRTNRVAYMCWLGQRLNYVKLEDWYQVTRQDFHDHGGAGLLNNDYRGSVVEAVAEFKPRLRLEEWRFQSVPQGFWNSADNRRRYMDWLGEELRIRTPELWYGVTAGDVRKHHGITLLTRHGDSVYRMVQEYLPDRDWIPWLFHSVPNGFWQAAVNRQCICAGWHLAWFPIANSPV